MAVGPQLHVGVRLFQAFLGMALLLSQLVSALNVTQEVCTTFSTASNNLYALPSCTSCDSQYSYCLTTSLSCNASIRCYRDLIICMNSYAVDKHRSKGCAQSNYLRLDLLGMVAGNPYNSTLTFRSCVAGLCRTLQNNLQTQCGTPTLSFATFWAFSNLSCRTSGETTSRTQTLTTSISPSATLSRAPTKSVTDTEEISMSASFTTTGTISATQTATQLSTSLSLSASGTLTKTFTRLSATFTASVSAASYHVSVRPNIVADTNLVTQGQGINFYFAVGNNDFDPSIPKDFLSLEDKFFDCISWTLPNPEDSNAYGWMIDKVWKASSFHLLNLSTLLLQMNGDPSLKLRNDVLMTFNFQRSCFRLRSGPTVNCTIFLRHIPLAVPGLSSTVVDFGLHGGAIASGLGGVSAFQSSVALIAMRSVTLLRLQVCDFYYNEPPPWYEYFFQIPIGDDPTKYHFGQTVLNISLVVFLLLAQLGFVHFYSEFKRISFRRSCARLAYPSLSITVGAFLLQPTLTAPLIVLIHGNGIAEQVTSGILFVILILGLVLIATRVTVFFQSEFLLFRELRQAISRLQTTEAQLKKLLKRKRKNKSTEGSGSPKSTFPELSTRLDALMEEFPEADEEWILLKASADERGLVQETRSKNLLKIIFVGSGKWRDIPLATDSTSPFRTKRSGYNGGSTEMFFSVFGGFREGRHWFVLVDILLTIAIAVVDSIRPTNFDCKPLMITLLVLFALYTVLLLVLRPYKAIFDQGLISLISLLQTSIAILSVISSTTDVNRTSIRIGSSVLTLITFCLLMLKGFIALVMAVAQCFQPKGSKHLRKRKSSSNRDSDSDTSTSDDEQEAPLLTVAPTPVHPVPSTPVATQSTQGASVAPPLAPNPLTAQPTPNALGQFSPAAVPNVISLWDDDGQSTTAAMPARPNFGRPDDYLMSRQILETVEAMRSELDALRKARDQSNVVSRLEESTSRQPSQQATQDAADKAPSPSPRVPAEEIPTDSTDEEVLLDRIRTKRRLGSLRRQRQMEQRNPTFRPHESQPLVVMSPTNPTSAPASKVSPPRSLDYDVL
jgi:hypothetical protein